MSAFVTIVRLILGRLLQRRLAILLALATLAPALVIALTGDEAPDVAFQVFMVALFVAIAIPITGLLTSTAAFGEERRASTLPYLLVKPIPRLVVAAAVTTAAILATLTIGLVGVVGSAVAISFQGGSMAGTWSALAALVVESIGYAAVFVPLGLLFRRATLAGLAYLFIWEGILAQSIDSLATASLWHTGLTAFAAFGPEPVAELAEPLGTLAPGFGGAMAKVGVILVFSLAFTTWFLKSRDVS